MTIRRLTLLAALAATAITPAFAQRRVASPEERIERLEKQVNQVQRRVYGKQPVDTAGYTLDPAVTQSELTNVATRLDSLERQMAELVRTSEENSNRVATLEAQIAQMRAAADRREREMPVTDDSAAVVDEQPVAANDGPPPPSRPKVETRRTDTVVTDAAVSTPPSSDPAEAAYDRGYQLWMQKKYDAAATALRSFSQQYPGHRRVSWANNLRGRALLDKGDYRGAAEVLLANYRGDKNGERAQDSLYYLGQASMKLGQPGQACKAYAELENVYGASMRSAVRSMLPAAKASAGCN